MKPTFYFLPILLFLGCSQHHPLQTKPECIQYQQELDELKDEQKNSMMQNIANLVVNGAVTPSKDDRREDEQKIRILEMKLSECNRQ